MTTISLLMESFDPFFPLYEQAEKVLQEADAVVTCAKSNWTRIPFRLRKGVVHNESETNQATAQVDRPEG